MNRKKTYTGFAIVLSLIMLVATFAHIQPAQARFVLTKEFSTSAVTYTNKTISFPYVGDPYEGYSIFTYDVGSTTNAPTDGFYVMSTNLDGEYAYCK